VTLRSEEQRLLSDFAVQLGRAFRNMGLESTLAQRLGNLRESTAALEASAHRLDLAQEAERARLESDLARAVVPHLRQVETQLRKVLEREDPRVASPSRLDELHLEVQMALEALRILTRGVFPAQLAPQGLPAALSGLMAREADGSLVADLAPARRFDPRVESTAYFCVAEIMRVVDSRVEVRLAENRTHLSVTCWPARLRRISTPCNP
jgi:signal transduction histidine kinase